ncbi:class Ib ribonucleoside-diphosphate reductase assembly flavoprotein NrdI [Deinococcus multiflagellatus]|uniref:Class Ib ribonucleoside-diphosphate reductase assembly flavoprotein NrdI n=1 Tax=Deinococcus multiflagellatus TaxID=1656887 RepID=A0ABW1ZIV8_9DEIO
MDGIRMSHGAPAGPYLLLTYTFGQGQVPASTQAFLAQHAAGLRGVVASGSYHWGAHFARAGTLIAAQYGVPLVARLNKGGTAADRAQVTAWLRAQAQLTDLHSPKRTPLWTPGPN